MASDVIPTQTLVCKFGISGLWSQDRTIRQLKEEAQHLSKLVVRHVMWGLDGLVLALVFGDFAFSTTLFWCFLSLGVPSARCLLLVVLCATVVKRESRKSMPKAFAWPSLLGCTSYIVMWYTCLI